MGVFTSPAALLSPAQPGPGSAARSPRPQGPPPKPLYLWSGGGDRHASHQTIPLVHSLRATGSFRAASDGDITCLQKSCKAKGLVKPAFPTPRSRPWGNSGADLSRRPQRRRPRKGHTPGAFGLNLARRCSLLGLYRLQRVFKLTADVENVKGFTQNSGFLTLLDTIEIPGSSGPTFPHDNHRLCQEAAAHLACKATWARAWPSQALGFVTFVLK